MRTPALIAKALGWPEANHRGPEAKPKLVVWFGRASGEWHWMTGEASGTLFRLRESGRAPSQPAALAVGLAALETAHVRNKR